MANTLVHQTNFLMDLAFVSFCIFSKCASHHGAVRVEIIDILKVYIGEFTDYLHVPISSVYSGAVMRNLQN
jgi:hypothetical protein